VRVEASPPGAACQHRAQERCRNQTAVETDGQWFRSLRLSFHIAPVITLRLWVIGNRRSVKVGGLFRISTNGPYGETGLYAMSYARRLCAHRWPPFCRWRTTNRDMSLDQTPVRCGESMDLFESLSAEEKIARDSFIHMENHTNLLLIEDSP